MVVGAFAAELVDAKVRMRAERARTEAEAREISVHRPVSVEIAAPRHGPNSSRHRDACTPRLPCFRPEVAREVLLAVDLVGREA